MLKTRMEAAEMVATDLQATEEAIDAALACAAKLMAAIPAARAHANLSAMVGQTAIECAAEACATLVKARQQIIAAHNELGETQKSIGLGERAFGSLGGKPSRAALRVVDAA